MAQTGLIAQVNGNGIEGGPLRVAVLGATGMVGQQFIRMLRKHPWFKIVTVAASAASAGKTYRDAVEGRWAMDFAIPEEVASMSLLDVQQVDEIASQIDVAFCAVNLDKEKIRKLEDEYARKGVWLTSNNSAFRRDPLVPMVIPAINPDHLDVVEHQRRARGYDMGAIIVKSNCSIQSYVIALDSLREFGVERITVHSEQSVSGKGKTFETWPEMERNIIPLIEGEEEKSEREPLKIWGKASADGIVPASSPRIKARCVRVAVADGHTAYVTATFKNLPTSEEVLELWGSHTRSLDLPSAPKKLIHYRSEPDRPQPLADVMTENGMAVTIGQLSVDRDEGTISFTGLTHNAILGAAGGAVWATEAAVTKGLVYRRV